MSKFHNFFNRLKLQLAKTVEERRNSSIPDDRWCSNCPYSKLKYNKEQPLLLSCYVCHLNPSEPVNMALAAEHSERKRRVQKK